MTFDKDRVLTPFTAHRASKGDWWVNNDKAEAPIEGQEELF